MTLINVGFAILAMSVAAAIIIFGFGLITIATGGNSLYWGPLVVGGFGASVIGIAIGGLVMVVGMFREDL